MTPQLWLAVGAVILAGLLQGVFAVPMKYARRWSYENIWLAFCLSECALAMAPHHTDGTLIPDRFMPPVRQKPGEHCRLWRVLGDGATLTGVGLTMLGIGLGMAIILGLCASVGSLIPLLVLTPQQLHTPQGHTYLIGTAIMWWYRGERTSRSVAGRGQEPGTK